MTFADEFIWKYVFVWQEEENNAAMEEMMRRYQEENAAAEEQAKKKKGGKGKDDGKKGLMADYDDDVHMGDILSYRYM